MPIPPFSSPSGASNIADSDLQGYLGRGGGQSAFNGTEINALASLVKDLKSTGLWTKLIAFYPFAGRSATPAAQNLISNSYALTWYGPWQYASWGVRGLGRGNWADTGFYPSTGFLSVQAGQNGIPSSPNNNFRSGSVGCHLLQTFNTYQVYPYEFYTNPTGVYGYCVNGSTSVTCPALPWAITGTPTISGIGITAGTTVSAGSLGATSLTLSSAYTGTTGYVNLTIALSAPNGVSGESLATNYSAGSVISNFPWWNRGGNGPQTTSCTNSASTWIASNKNSPYTDSSSLTNPNLDRYVWQGTSSSSITAVYSNTSENVSAAATQYLKYTYSGTLLIGGQYDSDIESANSRNYYNSDRPFNCAFIGYGLSYQDAQSLNTIMWNYSTNRSVNISTRSIVTLGDSIMSGYLTAYGSVTGLIGAAGTSTALLFNQPFSELTNQNLISYAVGGQFTSGVNDTFAYTAGAVVLACGCSSITTTTVTCSALAYSIYAGTLVSGTGIPSGTTVVTTAAAGATSITISQGYTGITGSQNITFASPAYGVGNVCMIWAGTNDLGHGAGATYTATSTVMNGLATTAFTNLQNVWAKARRDGYWTVALTVLKRSDFPSGSNSDNARIQLNNAIKAAAGIYVDQVIDVDSVFSYADVTGTSTVNPTYFAFDNGATISGAPQVYNNGALATGSYVHPNTLGQKKAMAYVAQYLK